MSARPRTNVTHVDMAQPHGARFIVVSSYSRHPRGALLRAPGAYLMVSSAGSMAPGTTHALCNYNLHVLRAVLWLAHTDPLRPAHSRTHSGISRKAERCTCAHLSGTAWQTTPTTSKAMARRRVSDVYLLLQHAALLLDVPPPQTVAIIYLPFPLSTRAA